MRFQLFLFNIIAIPLVVLINASYMENKGWSEFVLGFVSGSLITVSNAQIIMSEKRNN